MRCCCWCFLGGKPTPIMSFFLSIGPSVCPSVRCTPYTRNRTLSDHNFWHTYVKWWYIQVFFSFFFLIFIFQAVKGLKGQKMTKMKNNNYICHALCLRNSLAYDHDFWCTCVKWWYLQVFFSFFFNFDFSSCFGG